MIAIEEELNYKILEKRFKEQDRLIAEGKMQKPEFVYDVFTPEEQVAFNRGYTLEQIISELEQKYGKI